MEILKNIVFTTGQYEAWRKLLFSMGLGTGFILGACVVFVANILLGKYDELEEREKEENESN